MCDSGKWKKCDLEFAKKQVECKKSFNTTEKYSKIAQKNKSN